MFASTYKHVQDDVLHVIVDHYHEAAHSKLHTS